MHTKGGTKEECCTADVESNGAVADCGKKAKHFVKTVAGRRYLCGVHARSLRAKGRLIFDMEGK